MIIVRARRPRSGLLQTAAALVLLLLTGLSPVQAQDAAVLRARHVELREALAHNVFQRPLHLISRETGNTLVGEIHAEIEQPYAAVAAALRSGDDWCGVLILHLNVKSCRASVNNGNTRLSLHIGRKFDQPLADAYAFDFRYQLLAAGPDYLHLVMDADAGPLGTSDYRLAVEVIALDARRSFLHLSYAYRFGTSARMAMRGYLATTGRNKRGFSVVAGKAGATPVYIGGTRGVVERNTMRYYLAIEAYLGALRTAAPLRMDKRLNDWHAGVERYPLQLHELERGDYLAMKHREIARLDIAPVAAAKR